MEPPAFEIGQVYNTEQVIRLGGAVVTCGDIAVSNEDGVVQASMLQMTSDLQQITALLQQMSVRLPALEDRIDQLWYAPNMPGALGAQVSFNETKNLLLQDNNSRHVQGADTTQEDDTESEQLQE